MEMALKLYSCKFIYLLECSLPFYEERCFIESVTFILLFSNLEGMAGWDDSLVIRCSGNLWKWFLKDQIQRWKICWWIDTMQVFEWWSLLWVCYNSSVSLRLVDMFNVIHSFFFSLKKYCCLPGTVLGSRGIAMTKLTMFLLSCSLSF